MKETYIIVLVTAKDRRQAKTIAQKLLEQKLIACANIVDGIQSLFSWQGKIDQAKEVLLVLKTKKSVFNRLVKEVKAAHSYQVPEIIALPIVAGNKEYLQWIDANVQ
jgi:periplasmic divalent cation tolerance protein